MQISITGHHVEVTDALRAYVHKKMDRIVRHHRRAVPEAPRVSGYHDPRTAQFVELTRASRRASGLPDTCFERAKRGAGA